jgi:hypothetical protein
MVPRKGTTVSDALLTYMADRLAGSIHAIELLKHLQKEYQHHEIGRFAQGILLEIESDRRVLEELSERLGGGQSTVKEATAWAREKLSRLKLRHGEPESLGVEFSLPIRTSRGTVPYRGCEFNTACVSWAERGRG